MVARYCCESIIRWVGPALIVAAARSGSAIPACPPCPARPSVVPLSHSAGPSAQTIVQPLLIFACGLLLGALIATLLFIPFGYGGRLVMEAVWLRRAFGYGGRLVTEAVWSPTPFGYGGRLVTEAVWLRRLFGHGGRLVTKAVWLVTGPLVTEADWLHTVCLHRQVFNRHYKQKTFAWGLVDNMLQICVSYVFTCFFKKKLTVSYSCFLTISDKGNV